MGLDMKNIKIQDIEPGMVTAKDILASSGHLLLPSGTKLTTRYIRMLNARDIPFVAIESDDASPVVENPPTQVIPDERAHQIMKRFQYNDINHPFIKELVRTCTSRLTNRS
jgi:hypothetical protein